MKLLPVNPSGKTYILFNLALSYLRIAKYQSSLDIFQKTVEFINKNKNDYTLKILCQIYYFLSHIYSAKRDFENAMLYIKMSLELSKNIHFTRGKIDAYVCMTMIDLDNGRLNTALNNIDDALNISKNKNDEMFGRILSTKGVVHIWKGELKIALACFKKALQATKKSGNKHLRSMIYDNLGQVYMDLGSYDKALKDLFKAIEIDKSIGNLTGLTSDYCNTGITYKHLGDTDKALFYFEESLRTMRNIGYLRSEHAVLGNIGSIYIDKEDYENALKYTRSALKLCLKSQDIHSIGVNYSNLAIIYEKTGDNIKARIYLKKALKLHRDIGFKQGELFDLVNLGYHYMNMEGYRKAIGIFKSAVKIMDDYDIIIPNTPKEKLLERIETSTIRLNEKEKKTEH